MHKSVYKKSISLNEKNKSFNEKCFPLNGMGKPLNEVYRWFNGKNKKKFNRSDR